jgi:hypothetical protein
MKDSIIEIVELGQPQSLIQRENAPITELIKTDLLIEELNEQLRLYKVVGRSEQLRAFKAFLQSEYHLPISNRMVDEFEQKQSS